ncbi:MAG: aspartate-semialdehyde dehydrogenase [Myxococcales bacterium]|nr:aspartate-semialdehyde dehydrogenase [Myxococcales bacterium]MCB9750537.1 aspartate-semialdehyde dehydrogenase [Myxococcales bacterium]
MRICILGATGLVGRELIPLIHRAWPGAELALFASRARAFELDGQRYAVRAAPDLESGDAPRGELAFVALDDAHSARYVPRLLELGYRVVDKSNTFRLDPAVPLVVAGVNDALVTDEARLVANPNCTTIPLMLTIAPIVRRRPLETLAVASYQAISGAGIGTLDEFLDASRAGYTSEDRDQLRLGAGFDPAGYAANTVPHSGKTDDSGYSSEERKLMHESRKILARAALPVSAQCCRVAVAVGHYEQVWLTVGGEDDLSPGAIEAVLGDPAQSAFLRLLPGAAGDGLSALATLQHRDEVLVGRIRRDLRDPRGRSFCLTVTADNLRLGAATNAVRIASRWFAAADLALQGPGSSV